MEFIYPYIVYLSDHSVFQLFPTCVTIQSQSGYCCTQNMAALVLLLKHRYPQIESNSVLAPTFFKFFILSRHLDLEIHSPMKLLDLMKAKGPIPNTQTYTIIIRAFCKEREMDLVLGVFEDMRVAGCEPSVAIYTCLLTEFDNAGRMDRVISLLCQMEESSPTPDLHTYNAVIMLLTSHDMSEEANRVYKSMVQRGFEPSINIYNLIMKSPFSRNHEMGCWVWKEISKKGVSLNANSYTVFIAGHIQHGRVREAERYILEIVNKDMKAPLIDYNKFVSDFCRVGEPNKLEEMA